MIFSDFLISLLNYQLKIARCISARILIRTIGYSLSIWATLSRELPKLISSFVACCNFVIYLALPLWRVILWLSAAKLEMYDTSTNYFIYLSKINRKELFELALFSYSMSLFQFFIDRSKLRNPCDSLSSRSKRG